MGRTQAQFSYPIRRFDYDSQNRRKTLKLKTLTLKITNFYCIPSLQTMTEPSEASSSSSSQSKLMENKPVVVRVKRKANQERLDAFWLEINERPAKKTLLDLESLSVSDSSGKAITEARSKKLLVQHVETISSSEDAEDVLQSYLTNVSGSKDLKGKIEDRRSMLKQDKKQEQLRYTARQKHEDLVRSARFEQIWKSRRERMKNGEDSLHEICHLYDVVQVGNEDKNSRKVAKQERLSVEDNAILCNYLPLLREHISSAAEEIESEMRAYALGEESMSCGMNQSARSDYVYDLYTVQENPNGIDNEAAEITYPLVQVSEEDDYYDGASDSEYATDDSNAEDNPQNDYPDEESSEHEKDEFDYLDGNDSNYEDEVVDVSEEDDEDDWKWRHR
ncbi:uncharacterized protein A4U43_C08F33750 [Asparagus officinalis]|nr:uncharacterized protein A4U43_C08F33750 [Asparagus officinalis]